MFDISHIIEMVEGSGEAVALSLAVVGSAMAIFHNGQTCGEAPAVATFAGGGGDFVWLVPDFADAGLESFLIERPPCSGGRVAQPRLSFSQHNGTLRRGASDHDYGRAQPSLSSTYLHHHQHTHGELLANTRVIGVEGQLGAFTVSRCQGQQKELM